MKMPAIVLSILFLCHPSIAMERQTNSLGFGLGTLGDVELLLVAGAMVAFWAQGFTEPESQDIDARPQVRFNTDTPTIFTYSNPTATSPNRIQTPQYTRPKPPQQNPSIGASFAAAVGVENDQFAELENNLSSAISALRERLNSPVDRNIQIPNHAFSIFLKVLFQQGCFETAVNTFKNSLGLEELGASHYYQLLLMVFRYYPSDAIEPTIRAFFRDMSHCSWHGMHPQAILDDFNFCKKR